MLLSLILPLKKSLKLFRKLRSQVTACLRYSEIKARLGNLVRPCLLLKSRKKARDMCIYTYVYIHVHTHTYIYTHAYTLHWKKWNLCPWFLGKKAITWWWGGWRRLLSCNVDGPSFLMVENDLFLSFISNPFSEETVCVWELENQL